MKDKTAAIYFGRIVDDPRHSVGEKRFVLMCRSDQDRLLAVHATSRALNEKPMKKSKSPKKTARTDIDEILPEYDFRRARPNKYAARYKKGALVVTLDPEVARVFSTAEDVNQTLRSLVRVIESGRRRRSGEPHGA